MQKPPPTDTGRGWKLNGLRRWEECLQSGASAWQGWCQLSEKLYFSCNVWSLMGSHLQTSDWCCSPCHAPQYLVALHLASPWAHCHEECDTALHITSHTPKHHCDIAWQRTWHVMTPGDSFTRSQCVQVYSGATCVRSHPCVHLYTPQAAPSPGPGPLHQSVQASPGWHKSDTGDLSVLTSWDMEWCYIVTTQTISHRVFSRR